LSLAVGDVSVSSTAKDSILMDTVVTLGHIINLAVTFLDQNGNPMLKQPAADAPPLWSNTIPGTETIVASADGMAAVATPVAVGVDTINVAAIVGGKTFTATLNVQVTAAVAQVLTSVSIVPTVV
jgi:hypothetical protein